jgi:hypothetical protein
VRKYIDTVRWRFTAKNTTENKRDAVISKGISRRRYAKKKELTEYALSAYSCRAFESSRIKESNKYRTL